MLCTNCGKELPETAKVCGHCGHRLKSTVLPAIQPATVQPVVERRGIPVWAWILGGLILTGVFVGAIAILLLYKTNTPSSIPVQVLIAPPTVHVYPSPSLIPLPTNTPRPRITPTSAPKWSTVISENKLERDYQGPYWNPDYPYEYNIGTTKGSFRITFQYNWVGERKNCRTESFQIMISSDSSNLSILVEQDRTFDIWISGGGPQEYIDEDTFSTSIDPRMGIIKVEGIRDTVTVHMGETLLASFAYQGIERNSHNIVLDWGFTAWECRDHFPTFTDLSVQELH